MAIYKALTFGIFFGGGLGLLQGRTGMVCMSYYGSEDGSSVARGVLVGDDVGEHKMGGVIFESDDVETFAV